MDITNFTGFFRFVLQNLVLTSSELEYLSICCDWYHL